MIITLTGPSGIGKGYVACELKKYLPSMGELVWFTTRPLRPGEDNRSNRRSVSPAEFHRLACGDCLVLTQEVHGYMYGLELPHADYTYELWLCELHIDNMERAREIGLSMFTIALVPSSIVFLSKRLMEYRRTESKVEIEARLHAAKEEIVKIKRQQTAFDAFFEVTPENEHQIVADVIEALCQL